MTYAVKANVRAPHRFLRHGALCWVINTNPGGGSDKIEVWAMSRSGRKVVTWVDARDLGNYRAGYIPAADAEGPIPSPGERPAAAFPTREAAQAWADAMNKAFAAAPVRPYAAAFGRPA